MSFNKSTKKKYQNRLAFDMSIILYNKMVSESDKFKSHEFHDLQLPQLSQKEAWGATLSLKTDQNHNSINSTGKTLKAKGTTSDHKVQIWDRKMSSGSGAKKLSQRDIWIILGWDTSGEKLTPLDRMKP